MKSILFVNTSSLPIPATSGGAIQQVFGNILRLIDRTKYHITVITPSTEESKLQQKEAFFKEIEWIDIQGEVRSGGIKGILNSRRVLHASLASLDPARFSSVVVFDPYLAPIVKRWSPKAKVIWSAHNTREKSKWLLRFWMKKIDTIVSVSEFLKDSLETSIGTQSKHLTYEHAVIYNPLQKEWLEKPVTKSKKPGSILFCGRIVPHKGLDILLAAIEQLPQEIRSNVHLGIAGGSHFNNSVETNYVKSIKEKLEGSDYSCKMYGFVNHEALIDIYDEYEILVVPSNWAEPATLVTAEGQLRECKIIASAAGGLPELVSPPWKESIFPAGDAACLKAVLEKMLTDRGQSQEKVVSARKWVMNQFTDRKLSERWSSVLGG
ncbi:glycosyltransferase family 4 protein [Paenibacillus pasadenensis]|uniref:glycosyltransferase family 4 protein n=1 Tax=Paenibacillus pasadenensis TaxID=217090 RepID=UPI000C7D11C7|nr:glycosyltransferase family 4 protein [Paenibacillus pasadenensis]